MYCNRTHLGSSRTTPFALFYPSWNDCGLRQRVQGRHVIKSSISPVNDGTRARCIVAPIGVYLAIMLAAVADDATFPLNDNILTRSQSVADGTMSGVA